MDSTDRKKKEKEHGKWLSQHRPEHYWGWESKSGQIRARRRGALFIQHAGLKPNIQVLEVGCGTAVFTEKIIRSGADVYAIDISKDLLKKASERKSLKDRVQFIETSFENFNTQLRFNAILGSSVLHHLDLKRALRKMFTLLKPSGRFCFLEPNLLNPHIFIQKKIGFIKKYMGDSPDETAFIRYLLERILKQAGFVNLELIPFDWLHPATPDFLIPFVQKSGFILEKIPVLKEISGSLIICGQKPGGVT